MESYPAKPISVSELEAVNDCIRQSINELSEMIVNIELLADRLFGPQPPNGKEGRETVDDPLGVCGQISYSLTEQRETIVRLGQQLNRLQRL